MTLVTVLYPNTPGSRFDERYYVEKHLPLVRGRWGGMGCTDVRAVKAAGTPGGSPPPYRVIALLTFTSPDALQKAIGAHGQEIFADIPAFTDVTPVVQVNAPLG